MWTNDRLFTELPLLRAALTSEKYHRTQGTLTNFTVEKNINKEAFAFFQSFWKEATPTSTHSSLCCHWFLEKTTTQHSAQQRQKHRPSKRMRRTKVSSKLLNWKKKERTKKNVPPKSKAIKNDSLTDQRQPPNQHDRSIIYLFFGAPGQKKKIEFW